MTHLDPDPRYVEPEPHPVPDPDLRAIARRVDTDVRYRGAIEDTFGRRPHYASDGRDGHDCYDCAAADRAALFRLLPHRPRWWLGLVLVAVGLVVVWLVVRP